MQRTSIVIAQHERTPGAHHRDVSDVLEAHHPRPRRPPLGPGYGAPRRTTHRSARARYGFRLVDAREERGERDENGEAFRDVAVLTGTEPELGIDVGGLQEGDDEDRLCGVEPERDGLPIRPVMVRSCGHGRRELHVCADVGDEARGVQAREFEDVERGREGRRLGRAFSRRVEFIHGDGLGGDEGDVDWGDNSARRPTGAALVVLRRMM